MRFNLGWLAIFVVPLMSLAARSQEAETPTAIPLSEDAPPWAEADFQPPKVPLQEIAGPQQLLELLGVDPSQLNRFADHRPLHSDELEPLYRILYRIDRFQRNDLYRWRLQNVDWEHVIQQPEEYRASSVRLTGKVTRIEKEAILPEAARILKFDHFYRVTLQPEDAPYSALVCCRWLPRAWKVGEDVSYRGGAEGLLLKIGLTEDNQPQLVVVCDRMAWRPNAPDAARGVTPSHVLLASHGLDLGQLDLVLDRREITAFEREPFYQMLDAARRIDAKTLAQQAETNLPLAPLLQTPREMRGKLVSLTGEVRRVQEIRVDAKDIRERFGIDRYYEIDVFLPLANESIRMGESADAPVFENYFPVVFCMAELPPKMKPDDLIYREARLPAFYFKLWAYKTEFMERHGDRDVQLGPMLIGRTFEVLPRPAAPTGLFGTVLAVVFVATLAVVWVWVSRTGKTDAAHARELRRRRQNAQEGGSSLDNLEAKPPDFSQLKADDE